MQESPPGPVDDGPQLPDALIDPEARGPHLPDALGRLPVLAWLFVLLAVADFIWLTVDSNLGAGGSLADVASLASQVIPSVTAILLPAALLARHPDARTRAATLLFGTILYAVVQGLLVLRQPLQSFFETAMPASQDLPGLVPLSAVYEVLISLVAAFGLAYLALGLLQARRYEDRSGPLTALLLPAAAVLATILSVLAIARIELGDTPMSPALAIYLGSSVALGVLRVVVWANLTTVLVRGWRAGEDPTGGWRLGTIGGGFVLLALGLVNMGGLLDIRDTTVSLLYGYATAGAYGIGHLSLLAAFAIGLPALGVVDDDDDDEDEDDEEDEEDEDNEDGFEDEEAGFEGGPVYEAGPAYEDEANEDEIKPEPVREG